MPSMPRSSSCSTLRCKANPSPSVAGLSLPLATSYEAKAFGVRSGMSGRQARELCPQLIFVSGHFTDYQRLGDAAIRAIGDFTPLVERISIDEAFADVAGCTHLFGSPAEIARAIRQRVRAELGLAISVGVARTKHLAKIASHKSVGPRARIDPIELLSKIGTFLAAIAALISVYAFVFDEGPATDIRVSFKIPIVNYDASSVIRDSRTGLLSGVVSI